MISKSYNEDIEKVLYSRADIDSIVKRLGKQITEDYKGKDLLLIGILKGSVLFMADLMRNIDLPCNIDFMAVSSYGDGTKTSGVVRINKDLDKPIEGKDVLVIKAGQIVYDALDCAEKLDGEGIDVEVIDMFCIKPLDKELVKKAVAGKKAVVTFENHSIYGGLGSSVAELLAEEGIAVPFKRHGVDEQFGQVGSPDFLQKEFKLTAEGLEEVIKSVLK